MTKELNHHLDIKPLLQEADIAVFPVSQYNFSDVWHDYDINNEPEIIPHMIIDVRLCNGVIMTDAPMMILKKGEFALKIIAYKYKPDVKRWCFKEGHNNQVFFSNSVGICYNCQEQAAKLSITKIGNDENNI